ncbi:hypothetical protein CsSME_00001353 [Camellia sinensis var. sinensis]
MLIYCRSTSSPFSSSICSSPLNLPNVDLRHFIFSSPNLRENFHLKRKKKALSLSLSSTPNPPPPLSSLSPLSLKTPLKLSTSIFSASLFDFSQNPSPTLIYNDSDAKSKPRKRLIKKNTTADESTPDFGIGEEDNGDELGDFVRGESDYDDAFFPCATLLVNGLGRSIAKRLSEVTVMLRTKFRNYLQVVVEKLAGNLVTWRHIILKAHIAHFLHAWALAGVGNVHMPGIGNSAYNTIGYPPTQSHVNFDGRAVNETTAKLHNSSAPHGLQNVSPCPTLFVANLGPSCSEEELIQVFSSCPGFLKLKMQSTYGTPVAFVDFQPKGWRAITETYSEKLMDLACKLLEVLSEAMGLENEALTKAYVDMELVILKF